MSAKRNPCRGNDVSGSKRPIRTKVAVVSRRVEVFNTLVVAVLVMTIVIDYN